MNNMNMNRHLSLLDEDDDADFGNYIEATTDPGNTLFFIALFISILSLLCLPLLVKIHGKCLAKKPHEGVTNSNSDSEEHHGENISALALYSSGVHPSQTDASNLSFIQRCRRMTYSALLFVLDNVVRWRKRGAHAGENMSGRREAVSRGVAREAQMSMYIHRQAAQTDADDDHIDIDLGGSIEIVHSPTQNYDNQMQIPMSQDYEKKSEYEDVNDYENKNDQLETYDQENSITPPRRVGFLHKTLLFLWTIVKYDNETKRLLRLAIPFTFSAVADTTADLVILAIISQYIGTDSMIAYAMTDVIVGISASFMGGWVEAISSLGSMAYGAGNFELAGQYVQNACIGYVLCEIPMAFVWGFSIGHIMLLMGFDESIAELSQSFVWVKVAINMMEGLNECVMDFLEVIEKEAYANVMFCLSSGTQVGLAALFAIYMEANLVILGLVLLVNQALFFFINVLIPNKLGWFRRFEDGLFGRCSCRNTSALKELFKTALPLAFGSLLAYAEWEILTIFAATLGPAEAATWAILGFVWDVFESTTEAIGDASEVRCAYQLGKGRPALAKLSAYKSMLLATILACVVTAVFMSLNSILPSLLTRDPTIQSMLVELFPLMALGNVTMTFGMVCWALIGAQGRYRLATSIAIGCSVLITVPIGAVMTMWLKINLQGLTFAVVMGYTATAMILSTFLYMSDWELLSKIIGEKMAAEEEYDDDDDSSSSSSSSDKSERSCDTQDHAGEHLKSDTSPGYLEIPSTSPGGVAPPPPALPVTPDDEQNHNPFGFKHLLPIPHRTESLPPQLPLNTSPPRSSLPRSITLSSHNSPRTPPRRPQLTPEQKREKSLAKLRSLSHEHVPELPRTPGSPFNHAHSPARSDASSPRVVKGRRKRIH